MPEALRATLEREQSHGLLIVQVEPGSPADIAGLLLGDAIVGIDSTPLIDVDSLRAHLLAGKTITIHTLRGGERRDFEVTIAVQR